MAKDVTEVRDGNAPKFSVTRTTDTWTIVCIGPLQPPATAELERVGRACLGEWPNALRLDLSGVGDVGEEGLDVLAEIVSGCKERGVRLRIFMSLETPVNLIVSLDDRIRDRSRVDAVGVGGQGPASFRFERGGVVISV